MSAESFRVVRFEQHPEHAETVVDWLEGEWTDSTSDEYMQTLVGINDCPPALIAVSGDEPIAVLGYKLYPLTEPNSMELWINVLFVVSSWRGRGVGTNLLSEGVKGAIPSHGEALYVYTDVPQFYERLGWQRVSFDDTQGMHILRISRHE